MRSDHEVATPLVQRVAANTYVWLFGRRVFYRWNLGLLRIAVHGMGFGNLTTDRISPGEDRLLRRLASIENLCALDVGAYEGDYSSRLRRLCPGSRVWSFEPNPSTYSRLLEAASTDGFVAVNMGLSDRVGILQLYDYQDPTGRSSTAHASLYRDVFETVHHTQSASVQVEVTTVDEFMDSHHISHVHLLKVDAEGHELAILRGAKQAITSRRVDIVQFECNEMNVASRVFFKDFYQVLPGFSFYRMVVDGLASIGAYQPRTHELFFLQNVIAIRDDLEYRSRLV